ncbi:polyprenyl synthetase family protein [Candidatus Shapirobacteria bacterium CG10_big_fil_rev_8_21_14_0_10_40_9]|uniref:Polyprenyl synthetase family protein n=1 Tax=Candidatus Shapirobacteria bacterium CG10_big_fil_rev_8_21_14_0_10_40_9 TaxID=1974888 RepID=A0A2M8L461_9BACT|nr:MAG: polyprenyl synthetase family protein [Candidatus Shapirobacteria bacterium CG10_big_fil_rev_8_21_14_0_10_40_9]
MDYKEYFLPYASEIDKFLARFFNQRIKEGNKFDPISGDVWRKLQGFVTGGKRIRGGLVRLGYECFKKASKEKILPISAAIEITHGAILIHDDIIDESPLRHGRPTVHKLYENYYQKCYQQGDASHYGESMAIIVGIVGYYGGISLLSQARFSGELKAKAIDEMARFMIETGYGETLDVDLAHRLKIEEKDVLTIHTLKTAQYTIVGPLKIGGILAGAREQQLKGFEDYGVPVGIAFQLQDDILGMFGSEEETGKPADDDIKEGKNTLLYTQTLKRGNSQQRKRLKSLWGRKNITSAEVKNAREIIRKTGSLEYSQELAKRLVEKGKKAVPEITKNKNLQEVFYSLADFVIEREK